MRSILQRACALLGLWAVASTCAVAGVNTAPLERALRWLEARQDAADGAWHGDTPVATMLQTAAALAAMQAAGRRAGAWYAGQAWLANHAATNTDTRARRLRALRPSLASVQDELDLLVRARNGSGWGLAQRYQRDPLDSALALAALWHAGSPADTRDAVAWLRGLLADDAAWPTGTGGPTPGTIAVLLESLAPAAAGDAALAQTLQARLATLTAERLASSSVVVRAMACLAWQALSPDAAEVRALLANLRAVQAEAGDVGGDVLATALLVRALAQAEAPAMAGRDERVAIGDVALRMAINATLGHGMLDDLTRGDLAQLVSLDLDGRGVRDLHGLEYATNLRSFTAGDSPVQDYAPLARLPLLAPRRAREISSRLPEPPVTLASETDEPQAVPLLPVPAGWLLLPLGVLLLRNPRARVQRTLLLAGLALGGQLPATTLAADPPPALAPRIADGVKAVSRQLLQATAHTPPEDTARETLDTTRALVIDLEHAFGQTARVATQTSPTRSAADWSPLPPATVDRAREVIAQLRVAATPTGRGTSGDKLQIALAEQRATLFQRWATELEATLAPEAPDRLARLVALRRRLQVDDSRVPRRGPASPTLQALPAPRR